jgi:two-component system copper resistance phosphate regulon response regulator CusR
MNALAHDSSPELVVADLVIDPVAQRAWRGTRRLRLTPRELSVLQLLASRPGHIVSREEIYREVWGAEPGSNLVDTTISHLRSKVDWGHRLRLIHTVRGSGYVLTPRAEAPIGAVAARA